MRSGENKVGQSVHIASASCIAMAALLTGCTTAKVNFVIQQPVGKDQVMTPEQFNDDGLSFRIARSQISIARKAQSTGDNKSQQPNFVDTVIDPFPTTNQPILLPLNEKLFYYYTLNYTSPQPTGLTRDSFDKLIKNGSLSAWPIPACGTATVTIYAADDATLPDLNVTAVPTELVYPAALGDKVKDYSELYRATGVDNLGSTTALKVTYLPNTKIIQTIGTTVTDHVVDDVKTITAVATAAASFVMMDYKLTLHPAAAPPTLFAKANFTVQVADSQILQSLSLPSNGSITMNPVCGADRTDSATGGPAAVANDLTQIMTSVQSAYEAWSKPPTATVPKPK